MGDRATADLIGSTLAGYRVDALIKRGGMGVVYRGTDLTLGRPVAIKVLAPEISAKEDFRRRFIRESQMAAAIDHPNILPIYGAGEESGLLWIAMRFVDGVSLRDLLRKEESLALFRTLSITAQVGRALDVAHSRNLIHRDVKPANVLVTTGDSEAPDHVYLFDFGLTKLQAEDSGITGSGQFLGTIDYMAPEQIQGGLVDGRADIYSLGCMFYECLAGQPPFLRETDVATISAHLFDPPPLLSEVRRDLPSKLDGAIVRAMAKDPHDRFQSCREFLLAVAGPPADRNLAELGGAGAVDLHEVEDASKRPATIKARPVPGQRPKRQRRARRLVVLGLVLLLLASVGVPVYLVTRNSRDRAGTDAPGRAGPSIGSGLPRAVPTLAGMSSALAAETLRDAQFTPLIEHKQSKLYDEGMVISSEPGAGARLDPGSVVALVVSSGPGPRLVFMRGGQGPFHDSLCGLPANAHCQYTVWVKDWNGTAGATPLFGARSNDLYPSLSPDGSRVAFSRRGSNNDLDIWVANADGTSAQNLTRWAGVDIEPTWSPDGERIAFASSHDDPNQVHCPAGACRFQIFVVALNGGSPPVNISNDLQIKDTSPSWSPDGKQIAFVRTHDGNLDVFVMNVDGSGRRNLTPRNATADVTPDWSASGELIAYASYQRGAADIYVTPPTGSFHRRLTSTGGVDEYPVWGPLDRQIIFTRRPRFAEQRQVYVMNADGSDQRLLLPMSSYDQAAPSF